ncbi:electron transfer flavoprotein subunit alpha [Ferrimonas sediminicola]|uniref:Electron transfer flavoprotein subunit alpha n=1 Tax=Ferrimonas sediminicola TaxID=2569538 RepID=A0A4U1BGU4_9GAMM|nr:FAD-binding protein [Ferrimonas sediminicola]TKB49251.1 electron transfer flavoprotein subunit alpha [Ferrimonas sediminicola]
MSKLQNVWVFSDNASRLPELITGAKELGEQVSALVLGNQQQVDHALALGAHKVYHLGEKPAERIVEDYADTLVQILKEAGERSLVLMAATRRGKALAAKLGNRLDAAVFNDACEIRSEADAIIAKHMVYGGLALGEEKLSSNIALVTLASGTFEPASEGDAQGETLTLSYVEPKAAIKCIERRAKEGEGVDLSRAKRVVGVGSGIASLENLKQAEALAGLLGAEMGCSRPIAETEKWMERERYIGVSGVMLKPDLYLAVGISGQIQHMVGVNGAQTIIAINKDKNAPIFQYADYGLIGDTTKVIPALVEALKG